MRFRGVDAESPLGQRVIQAFQGRVSQFLGIGRQSSMLAVGDSLGYRRVYDGVEMAYQSLFGRETVTVTFSPEALADAEREIEEQGTQSEVNTVYEGGYICVIPNTIGFADFDAADTLGARLDLNGKEIMTVPLPHARRESHTCWFGNLKGHMHSYNAESVGMDVNKQNPNYPGSNRNPTTRGSMFAKIEPPRRDGYMPYYAQYAGIPFTGMAPATIVERNASGGGGLNAGGKNVVTVVCTGSSELRYAAAACFVVVHFFSNKDYRTVSTGYGGSRPDGAPTRLNDYPVLLVFDVQLDRGAVAELHFDLRSNAPLFPPAIAPHQVDGVTTMLDDQLDGRMRYRYYQYTSPYTGVVSRRPDYYYPP